MNEDQQKQLGEKFQEVLQYRLGLRLMAEAADKLGEEREAFAKRADSMDQKEVDKLIGDIFSEEQIEKFADEEAKRIIQELAAK